MTFENGPWLSFALMAGAAYEGLLDWKVEERSKSDRFSDPIRKAVTESLVDEDEKAVLSIAKDNRNLVHAGRCDEPYVTRGGAMDMRRVLDRVIRKLASDSNGLARSAPVIRLGKPTPGREERGIKIPGAEH